METNDTPFSEPAAPVVTMDRMWGGDAVGTGLDPEIVTTRLRALRFGMFVHWGLYSSLGGRWHGKTYYGIGEWKHAEQVGPWGAEGVACWTVEIPVAGDWRIGVRCRGEGRLVWKCASDEGDFVQNQQGATAAYAVMPLGFLTIQTAGRRTLSLSLLDGNRDCASLEGIVVNKGMS